MFQRLKTSLIWRDYGAVLVGSAAHMAAWLPEALRFVKTNRTRLNTIPVFYFTVCLTLKENSAENREIVKLYSHEAKKEVNPRQEGLFAGRVDFTKIPFPDRLILKLGKTVEGDFRQWNLIRFWTEKLPLR